MQKGRISVGGATAKPSRTIKVGDVIEVRKPPVTYSFRVKAPPKTVLAHALCPTIWKTSPRRVSSTCLRS